MVFPWARLNPLELRDFHEKTTTTKLVLPFMLQGLLIEIVLFCERLIVEMNRP